MADLIISDDVRKTFPNIVELVLRSESMNDEERQYWINILPIMTPPQVDQLKNILENERKQLSAIDKKYAKEIDQIGKDQFLKQADSLRHHKRLERAQAESKGQSAEVKIAEDLLKKIQES
jgi:hypothetical protein